MGDSQKKSLFRDPLILFLALLLVVGLSLGFWYYTDWVRNNEAARVFQKADHLDRSGKLMGAIKCYETLIKDYPNYGLATPAKLILNELHDELQKSGTKDNTPERDVWLAKYKTQDTKELSAKYHLRNVKAGLGQTLKIRTISYLNLIIKDYPDTEAAKEAKKLLDELKQEGKP